MPKKLENITNQLRVIPSEYLEEKVHILRFPLDMYHFYFMYSLINP